MNVPYFRKTRIAQQSGFTLVEIMVAITLGLIITAGVMQVTLSGKQTYRLQTEVARVQEDARFMMEALHRDIRMAGFSDRFNSSVAKIVNLGTDTDDGGGSANDKIAISYQSNEDCLGQNTSGTGVTINKYYIDNDNQLVCDGSGGTPQPLISNVKSLQILYGEAGAPGGSNPNPTTAARYVNADDVIVNRIVSVRIAVLLQSSERISADSGRTYKLLDAPAQSCDAGYFCQQYTTTIALRN